MSSFWKYKSLPSRAFTRYGRVAWASPLSFLTLYLLAYLLGFKSFDPFDLSGWKPITGWFIIYLAFNWIYAQFLGIFYKPRESFKQQCDNYILSVAEMEAEKSANVNKNA